MPLSLGVLPDEELADFWALGIAVEAWLLDDQAIARAAAQGRVQQASSWSSMGTAETSWRRVNGSEKLSAYRDSSVVVPPGGRASDGYADRVDDRDVYQVLWEPFFHGQFALLEQRLAVEHRPVVAAEFARVVAELEARAGRRFEVSAAAGPGVYHEALRALAALDAFAGEHDAARAIRVELLRLGVRVAQTRPWQPLVLDPPESGAQLGKVELRPRPPPPWVPIEECSSCRVLEQHFEVPQRGDGRPASLDWLDTVSRVPAPGGTDPSRKRWVSLLRCLECGSVYESVLSDARETFTRLSVCSALDRLWSGVGQEVTDAARVLASAVPAMLARFAALVAAAPGPPPALLRHAIACLVDAALLADDRPALEGLLGHRDPAIGAEAALAVLDRAATVPAPLPWGLRGEQRKVHDKARRLLATDGGARARLEALMDVATRGP